MSSETFQRRETNRFYGASEGTRTLDLRFTKPMLYQLSYAGLPGRINAELTIPNAPHDCQVFTPVTCLRSAFRLYFMLRLSVRSQSID